MTLACSTIADYPTANGAMGLLFSVRDCVPFAFSALAVAIFVILFAGQYFLIKNRTGRAKILVALLSSSFVSVILTMFLALSQLVPYVMVIFFGFLAIVSFILFELSDNS